MKSTLVTWSCLIVGAIFMTLANSLLSLLMAFIIPFGLWFVIACYEDIKARKLIELRWGKVKEVLSLMELPQGDNKGVDNNGYWLRLEEGLYRIEFEKNTANVLNIEGKTWKSIYGNEYISDLDAKESRKKYLIG